MLITQKMNNFAYTFYATNKNMKKKPDIEDIYRFYQTAKETHAGILQHLKRRIHHIGTIRLFIIIGMLVTLWFCRHQPLPALIGIAAAFLLLFLLLVIYHTKLHTKRTYEEGLIELCEHELKALDYDLSAFDGAPEQIDAQHAFSLDLDLFGEQSVFQMANRTVTQMGHAQLVDWFKQPLDDKKKIIERQYGIQEMSLLHAFRHDFRVTGKNALREKKDIRFLFMEKDNNTRRISDNLSYKVLIWLVPVVWIFLIIGNILGFIGSGAIGIFLAISFILTNLPAKQIQRIYTSVNKTENILKTYSELIKQIEKENFKSAQLETYKQLLYDKSELSNSKISASYAIQRLSRHIGSLDQRFSAIGIILNLLYMRDTRQTMHIEQWKKKYTVHLKTWFDTLGTFDAFCSFGTFAFNHPDYIYPSIAETYFEMEGKSLGHPLIHRDKSVCNDIHIPHNKFFLIVTGANMAGKSTYLRTVGINFLLACIGLPVYAQSLTVYPARLATSLRTADSLVSNESYFFAELKRLKMIIDRLNAGEQLFIILDEILKGTNSVDKQKGSIALMKQLINKNTCGIIATHDLLLGSLSDTFPKNVQNKRFEADITNNELTFTYKIRDGIAQNMNATFLMKKMGIFDDKCDA